MKPTKVVGRSRLFSNVIIAAIPEIQSRWELGDIENNFIKEKFDCSDLIAKSKLVGQEYFQCNRLYLECFLQGKAGSKPEFKVRVDGKQYNVVAYRKKDQRFTKITPDGQVKFDLKVKQIPGKRIAIKLQNTCSDLYLPHGIYSAGLASEHEKIWDNIGQNIYVDKYYVTRKDVNEWIEAGAQDIKKVVDPMWFPFPSTDLSLEQRKRYCAFRGKQLISSRVLDAASFIPDVNVQKGNKVYKAPYHWTKGKRDSFLYQAKMNQEMKLTQSMCQKAYVAGCQRISMVVHFPSDAVSWMGMKYPLGFYPELVVNHFEPEKNVMPSSFYFDANSSAHEIGRRIEWDGQGWGIQNLKLDDIDSNIDSKRIDKFEMAFRCMKVVSQ